MNLDLDNVNKFLLGSHFAVVAGILAQETSPARIARLFQNAGCVAQDGFPIAMLRFQHPYLNLHNPTYHSLFSDQFVTFFYLMLAVIFCCICTKRFKLGLWVNSVF